jgi:IS5 family transposase
MRGKQRDNTDLFQLVTMETLVPADHRLRRLNAVLDLSFVDKCVASLYSSIGRASVDPEVVVRMWILQRLHGYSERELCDEMQMHAGFRWFCGLSFNDRIPDQSTLVKLRTDKWSESKIWEALLRETVRACEAAGIASPGRLGVDGTQILANAATVSLEEIPPSLKLVTCEPAMEEKPSVEPETHPPDSTPELRVEAVEGAKDKHKSGDPDWHGEKFSNSTHRSKTDPEARLYRKGKSQEAKLRYLGHYLADIKSGVIYDAMATQATGTAEREATIEMLNGLAVLPGELAMDLGYRDGAFLADLLDRGVMPLVPIGDEKLEKEPVWTRRTNNPNHQKKRDEQHAIVCARNAVRKAVRGRRGANAQRQRTRLEHLFAEGKDHHGLARAEGRGLTRVDQQVRVTAAVQNLKRLMASRRWRKAAEQVAIMPLKAHRAASRAVFGRKMPIQSRFYRSCAHAGFTQRKPIEGNR